MKFLVWERVHASLWSIIPLPDNKILDWSKLKQFADDNFKVNQNSRKFSKRVENTVGKGEIARYEQFLLFPQCFQKACFPGASKGVTEWEWVKTINSLPNDKFLDRSKFKAFGDDKLNAACRLNAAAMMISLLDGVENTVGKGKNAGYQHFLVFPQCFPKSTSLGSLNFGTVWKRDNASLYIYNF